MIQRERKEVKFYRAIDPIPSLIAWVHIRVREVPSSTIVIPVRSIGGII